MWRFPKMENSIGSVVIEILGFSQNNPTTVYNRIDVGIFYWDSLVLKA